VGVISEDWPAWLEVWPSLEITSSVIKYILAWERDQDFIKHCLPGLFPAYLSRHRWTDVYIQSWIWFYIGRHAGQLSEVDDDTLLLEAPATTTKRS
jgi:hypothetical protein